MSKSWACSRDAAFTKIGIITSRRGERGNKNNMIDYRHCTQDNSDSDYSIELLESSSKLLHSLNTPMEIALNKKEDK